MTTTSDFDRHASVWLADGPTELADRVIDAALREVHMTPQRRRWSAPGRHSLMSFRLAVGVLTAMVAAGGALYLLGPRSGPAITATPTAGAPSIAPITFTSPLYGYSVSIPGTWAATPASEPWQGGDGIEPQDPPYADVFRLDASPDGATVRVKARSVPDGTSATTWLAQWEAVRAVGGTCFGSATPWSDSSVAGVPARRYEWRCDNSPSTDAAPNYDEYAFVIGARGFVITGTPSMVGQLIQSFRAP